jgi:CubicO group peptidase (beta-lactamase class C family)
VGRSVAVVRDGAVARVTGDDRVMPAASLLKSVIAHVALAIVDDLDEPIWNDVTSRHVLTHTTGLPN